MGEKSHPGEGKGRRGKEKGPRIKLGSKRDHVYSENISEELEGRWQG